MQVCHSVANCQHVRGRIHPSAPVTKILMDTCSSISFISNFVFERHGLPSECVIKPQSSIIQSVDGTLLDILGATDVKVELASVSVSHSVVVANIIPSVLMGVDFLQAYQCTIAISHNCVQIKNCKISLLKNTPFSACVGTAQEEHRVRLTSQVVIPGFSEDISTAKIASEFHLQSGVVELSESFPEKFNVGAARALMTVDNELCISIRLQNLLADPITICKDAVMGMLEECTVEPTNIEQ